MTRNLKTILMATVVPLAFTVSSCKVADEPAKDQAASTDSASVEDESLTSLLRGTQSVSRFASIVDNAELSDIFEGDAPYTLLAPDNDAFDAMDPAALKQIEGKDGKAQATAFVRGHLLPGLVVAKDIGTAIDAADGKKVEMKLLSGEMATFTKKGDSIIVTGPDDLSATLSEGKAGENGGLIVIDAALLPINEKQSETSADEG